MKKLIAIMCMSFASLSLIACDNSSSHSSVADPAHNSQNALDYEGVYKGSIPAADGGDILVTLTLDKDDYELSMVFTEHKEDGPFTEKGKYHWNSEGNKITLEGITNAPNQYKVGENRLIQLDMNGEAITGDLAERYQLTKEVQ